MRLSQLRDNKMPPELKQRERRTLLSESNSLSQTITYRKFVILTLLCLLPFRVAMGEINIAVVLPLNMQWGMEFLRAAELAVKDVNDR